MILQAHETLVEEPPSPLRDDLPWQAQTPTDLLVFHPKRGQKNQLCPDNHKVW
jgi:hypothetical protein